MVRPIVLLSAWLRPTPMMTLIASIHSKGHRFHPWRFVRVSPKPPTLSKVYIGHPHAPPSPTCSAVIYKIVAPTLSGVSSIVRLSDALRLYIPPITLTSFIQHTPRFSHHPIKDSQASHLPPPSHTL